MDADTDCMSHLLPASRSRRRARLRGVFALALLSGGLSSWAEDSTGTPASAVTASNDAGKGYKPFEAVTEVADSPRYAHVDLGYGRKLSSNEQLQQVTITNPYMDPTRIAFGEIRDMQCTSDGGLIVSGNADPDADGRTLGTGYWRVSPAGAVTPLHARGIRSQARTARTLCEADFSKTNLYGGTFGLTGDGNLLTATGASVLTIDSRGYVKRLAGSPRDCENDNSPGISGFADGNADSARFNDVQRIVAEPGGNLWVADQGGCALRRITPEGHVSTVVPPEKICGKDIKGEDRLRLEFMAWDEGRGELVTGGGLSVALPVHNWYTTLWRVRPDGAYRRVLYATKVGKSPAKLKLDHLYALAVDKQSRIHITSRLMLFEQRGYDLLQLLRVDEAKATVVPLTGTKLRPGTIPQREPRDGAVTHAVFEKMRGLCFAPDGTTYVLDDHFVRRVDRNGQTGTWVY